MRRLSGVYARLAGIALLGLGALSARGADGVTGYKFSFDSGNTATGFTQVAADAAYSDAAGYGFEARSKVTEAGGIVTAESPFFFSAKLPEGNYRVTVTLGDPKAESVTTVKAELRRLMLERVHVDAGQSVTKSFVVNIRTPKLADGTVVELKDREKTSESWAWDDKLTLEFSDAHPAVSSIVIEPVEKVTTVYLIGDSTVCDLPSEPFSGWGQMLLRWFKGDVAVSNQGESGEPASGFVDARRIDKVLEKMTAGDYLIMQFGHNDMKNKSVDALTRFKKMLAQFSAETRARGGTPIICTPVSRKSFGEDGKIVNSFVSMQGDYVAAARETAAEEKVQLIDLNALTVTLYETAGPTDAAKLFAGPDQGTHHGDFGSYEIAKLVVQGIKESGLPLAGEVVEEWKPFDPAHGDPIAEFKLPVDPGISTQTPSGN